MSLTWKDGLATAATAGATVLFVADAVGAAAPGLSGTRVLAGVVLGLGMVGCGSSGDPGRAAANRSYTVPMSVIGGLALVAGIVALVTGSWPALAVLAGATVGLWLAATVRHALPRPPAAAPGPAAPPREPVGSAR